MFQHEFWKKSALCMGVLLLVAGSICHVYIDEIFHYTIAKMLQLSPNAAHYEMWRKTPIPVRMNIYMFNWTNPEEFTTPGVKPSFQQLGPYTFMEEHEKVNITWNPNNTVNYHQIRRWQFDPDNSNGSLDDLVTSVDLLSATASYLARDWGLFLQNGLSIVLDTAGKKPHMTHRVREVLFQGYDEPLIDFGSKLPFISQLNIPLDKIGWFYKRNGSTFFEGTYSMATGAGGADTIGRLVGWNYANRTRFYPDQCGMVNGSAGEMWPPFRKKTHSLSAFLPDLCRSLSLDYADEQMVEGILGYRYLAGARNFDNGTLQPENECFCGGQCIPSGLLNLSSCRFGGPAFLSYPHFYQADPYYLQQVDGLLPDQDSHEYYVTLEPITGIPLEAAARFQINVLVDRRKFVRIYRNAPRVFFPVLWIEGKASLGAELAAQVSSVVNLPHVLHWVFLSMLVLGAIMIGLLCLHSLLGAWCLQLTQDPSTIVLKKRRQLLDHSAPLKPDTMGRTEPRAKVQRHPVLEHVPLVNEPSS